MFGFQSFRDFYRHNHGATFPKNRTVLVGWFKAVALPLSALIGVQGFAFAWPDPETPKGPTGRRVQLYPNRETALAPQEKDFQNTRADHLAKSRKYARAHLDALRVELAWLADPVLFAHPPGIKAITTDEKPCVEIRGVVNSHAIRQRALEIAQRFCETPIRDKLLVLIGPSVPRQTVPMADLQAKAERYLADRLVEFSQDLKIEEVYPSGSIRVSGRVLSYEDKVAVSRSLRRLIGCMAVDNRIEVSPMSQDGELVTIITSDGETSLPGKIDEKRNGPVALTAIEKLKGDSPIAREDSRPPVVVPPPKPLEPIQPVKADKKKEAPFVRPNEIPSNSKGLTRPLSPLNAPVEKTEGEKPDNNPLTKPMEFGSASWKPATPRVNQNLSTGDPAPTTGIAVIEEGSGGQGDGAGVQTAGWGNNATSGTPVSLNPDGTPVEPKPGIAPFFPNRPRLFFQPSSTPPASQRPIAPQQQRSSVKLLPNASGAGQPNENGQANPQGNGTAGQELPSQKRTGFISGLGQPTIPRRQPYLSPIDVSQSGRVSAPVQRAQPNQVQPGQDGQGQAMIYGGSNRNFNGQNYQLPGSVRMTPSRVNSAQPGNPAPEESGTAGGFPWDQPVPGDSPARTVQDQPARNGMRPGRTPAVGGFGSGVPLQKPDSPNGSLMSQQRRPIASTEAPTQGTLPRSGQGMNGEPANPATSPAFLNNGSIPVSPRLTESSPFQGGTAKPRQLSPGLNDSPQQSNPIPAGQLPPPSTGSVIIEEEGPAIPAFVPTRRSGGGSRNEDQKNQEKNRNLIGNPGGNPVSPPPMPLPGTSSLPVGRPSAPMPAGAGSMTLGSMEIEKDSINRPLPSPESLNDLARKTCGSLISDIKTRKDGNAICVEIVVKDALTEDEVLKRLFNLAAFSHPAIRIEVTRAP